MDSGQDVRKYVPMITILLVAANVLVYLYAEATGGSENIEHMVQLGAMAQTEFFQGEYYRLITHFFLHFGFSHLCNNMFSLAILGFSLEEGIGRVRLLLVYFLSGISAGICSLLYNIWIGETYVVSAGASGAIYGLMGALLALMIFRRKRRFQSEVPRFLLFIGISIYSGMQDTSIDNAAHVGGLVTGFLICAVMSLLIKRKERRRRYAD